SIFMNYSRQREIIKDTLIKNPIHPTAEQLLAIIRKEHPLSNIGIATVYRNLSKLAEAGEIKRIIGLETSEHFDHNTFVHYHFYCKKCGKVYDIDSAVADNIVENTKLQTGFIVDDYDIVFHGICKNCRNQ
ncbi:MAG: transcriptional repressor, partial [Candidatus Gastranaerophilales bacterium]|nr:transcriptional repressor [Candidatus Gastranaerophilales bacterium]